MKKTILITGAGRGIGAATALEAARRDYAVVVNYRDNAVHAADIVRQIEAAGGQALAIRADVASEAAVQMLFEEAEKHFGYISALVNNAGIIATQSAFADMSPERWQHIFSVNVFGTFLCAREAVRRMSRSRGGQGGGIVNVSSLASRFGSPFEYVDYAASKGAIDTFTAGLAKEVAGEGIRVNAVRPGFIKTDIHASGGEPGRVERLKSQVPMQRGGEPEEIAKAILWLLSDEASYVTGTVMDVTGGR
jgi:NAD(P)-dependent dehydrogenase (short-subunit alcohol dehydrogenase family)